jgi:HSP20 family protein
MTLIRYNRPETDFFGKRFSDIMDEFFNDAVHTRRDSFMPTIDIAETETAYNIDVQLPGMKKEDINIEMENGRLTISGERKFENEENGKTWRKVESQYGSFARSFQLPENVESDSIKATYTDGILKLNVTKSKEQMKKQIQIK